MIELKTLASEQRKSITLLYTLSLLSGIMIVCQSYLFVAIVDRIFIKKQSFEEILLSLSLLLLALFIRAVLRYFNGRIGVRMGAKVKAKLRNDLLNKYADNPVQTSLQGQSGHKVSVIMDGVDGIDGYFSGYIPQKIQSSIIPIIILIVIFTQHVTTGLIILITAPFIPFFMIMIGKKTNIKAEEQLEKMAIFSGRFLDTLQGLTTLKLFGKAKQQREEIKQSSLNFRDATMEVLKIAFTSALMLEMISMLGMGLIALEISLRLIVFNSISFFTAFFVLVLAPEFFVSLKELGSAFHKSRESIGAAKNIDVDLAATGVAISWGEAVMEEKSPPQIELQALGFNYGENAFALKNINMRIEPYENVAIIGASGSGKTTLLHMIAGLIPYSTGEVFVNDRKRSHYTEKAWFGQISYISQDPYLFSGTIAENILIGATSEAGREDVIIAARKAGIETMIESLENGYDTSIGEAGRGLSGGEKQRVAIARAFLKQPSIILFDEPTTGLDLETEQILQASIAELSKTSTVITVAHRLHTIKNADQIILLENGEISANGTHQELIVKNDAYRAMVLVQKGGIS